MRGKFIAYYRVSTDKQGQSGLGLEAQRRAVTDYLDGGNWTLIEEFTEVESGKHSSRPQLAAALKACKQHRARLVIAKLDRLSRNVAFIAALMESKVEFICCDMPAANKTMLHFMAVMAEAERDEEAMAKVAKGVNASGEIWSVAIEAGEGVVVAPPFQGSDICIVTTLIDFCLLGFSIMGEVWAVALEAGEGVVAGFAIRLQPSTVRRLIRTPLFQGRAI